jgi:hypothetical protein
MTPSRRPIGRLAGASIVGLLAIVLGGTSGAITLIAALSGTEFVNPHAVLYVAFYGGGFLCPAAALAVVRRLVRRAGWPKLDVGLVAVNLTWFCWFVGVWGLTAN